MKPSTLDPAKISDADWRQRLTPEQYDICRRGGTERPGSGKYLHHAGDGTYACVACGQTLFDSTTKYDACGWPSFWDAVAGGVRLQGDGGAAEAVCSRCDSHLGHLFDDGPPPTGKRY